MAERPRRNAFRAVSGAALLVAAAGMGMAAAQADDSSGTFAAPFTATADAQVTNVLLHAPGAPLTSDIVDTGGPTAQTELDSTSTSTGYAAFPDPGPLVIAVPGLVSGLINQGIAGLPPIKNLPSLPQYPLYVTSDANNGPHVQLGKGPYALQADSSPSATSATATAGVDGSPLGDAGLATAAASVTTSSSSVVATGTAKVEGLVIGPLSIGSIVSTASLTLGADGTLTPSDSFDISGLKVGGVPVSITADGLVLGGPTIPLPIGATLNGILSGAGITATLLAPTTSKGQVESAALALSMPAQIPSVSTGPGSLTVTIGRALVTVSGAASAPSSAGGGTAAAVPPPSSTGSVALGGSAGGPGLTPSIAAPSPASASASASPSSPGSAPASSGVPQRLFAVTAAAGGVWDTKSLYLAAFACALAIAGLGQLVRLLGVRGPWTSIGG